MHSLWEVLRSLSFYNEQTKVTQSILKVHSTLSFFEEQTKIMQSLLQVLRSLSSYNEQTKVTQSQRYPSTYRAPIEGAPTIQILIIFWALRLSHKKCELTSTFNSNEHSDWRPKLIHMHASIVRQYLVDIWESYSYILRPYLQRANKMKT